MRISSTIRGEGRNHLKALLTLGACIIVCCEVSFSANKTFTGPGDFSNAALWDGGTLPVAGDRLIIMGTCFIDAAMAELAYSDLQVGKGLPENMAGTIFWPIGSAKTLNVQNISAAAGPGGTVDMTNGGTWKIRGAWNNAAISFIPGTGTVDIEVSPPPFNLPADVPVYNNLIINPGAGVNAVMGTSITVKNLTINSGANFDIRDGANTYNITITGDWSNSGTFDERTSTVIFNGSGAQSITATGGETFYSLTMNKPSGDVTLNNNVTVNNLLALTSGDLVLGSNDLTIGNTGTTSGASISSYVQADGSGVMKKNYNATGTFAFPVGDADDYSPMTIDLNSATFGGSDFLSVKITDAAHPNNTDTVYITRYWKMNYGGFASIDYDVNYQYVDADVVGAEASLFATRWDGINWYAYNPVDSATNTLSGNGITALPGNHDWTAANALLALPIELVSFLASVQSGTVKLSWATASETNNSHFEIERSQDGTNWQFVYAERSKNSNSKTLQSYEAVDKPPFSGTYFYRLKSIDLDSRSYYSQVIEISVQVNSKTFCVSDNYPNPCKDKTRVNLILPEDGYVVCTIYNVIGQQVWEFSEMRKAGENVFDISVSVLHTGTYFYRLTFYNKSFTQKLVVMKD